MSFKLKIWLFCLLFAPITLMLGFWQLDRAEQKTVELSQRELLNNSVEHIEDSTVLEGLDMFRRVTVDGSYLPKLWLLENRTRAGAIGYELFQWFELDAGGSILVGRGWLPAPMLRSDVPAFDLASGEHRLEGYFYRGHLPSVDPSDNVERLSYPNASLFRIQFLDWTHFEREGLSRLAEFRLANARQAGALDTFWHYSDMGPDKHRGYAVQWFALFVALIVLSIAATAKVRTENNKEIGD